MVQNIYARTGPASDRCWLSPRWCQRCLVRLVPFCNPNPSPHRTATQSFYIQCENIPFHVYIYQHDWYHIQQRKHETNALLTLSEERPRPNQYLLLTEDYQSGYGSQWHYSDIIMGTIASQITSLTIVYATIYSGADKKKTSKLRVTGLCEGNSPVTGEFPAQMASNAENVSIWWRLHGKRSMIAAHEAGTGALYTWLTTDPWNLTEAVVDRWSGTEKLAAEYHQTYSHDHFP